MELAAKNQENLALVLGLGRSGRALGNHLSRKGLPFWVYDDKGKEAFASLLAAWPHAQWLADHTSVSRILLSPGVPSHHPLLMRARAQGIPIISELEFAWRLAKIPMIAITGTNGKSTTTALVEHFLTHAGYRAKACGNFGVPLLEVIDSEIPLDVAVVEVSSFQVEESPTFKPRYAALLNVTPDHLDRYASMDDYLAAKLAMIANQDASDILVYNAEEPAFFKAVQISRAQCLPFSSTKTLKHGAYLNGSSLVLPGSTASISLDHNPLMGLHHLENILAAALLAHSFGASSAEISAALPSFTGLPHRLERIIEKNGVVFYDDSKGTNVGALAMSLASFADKVVLIAGGRDKGGDFASLRSLVRAKVEHVVVIGEAQEKIAAAWQDIVRLSTAPDLPTAVKIAYDAARPLRYPVLLSPGCASFDQFTDYKHRGHIFQEAARRVC